MKKILYIGGFELPDKNAAAQRVLSNAKLLREMGYQVTFIGVTKDYKNATNNYGGFVDNPIPYPVGIRQWIKQLFAFIDIDNLLRQKPDYVILYNFPSIASLKILKACHKYGIKVIHDLTEWETSTGWSVRSIIKKIDIVLRMRYCIKRMDGVIAISRYLYDFYSNKTKCILVPPTVDLRDLKWNRERQITVGNEIKLIYAGNPGYGIKDRIDIIVNTVSKYHNLQLDIIGISEEQYVNGYGTLPNKSSNINFCGRVSHEEAICAVQNADFQFLIRDNNRKNNAGFPTKLVESMTCGIPLIATLTSNIDDYLIDGNNSFIISDNRTLDSILQVISRMPKSQILEMKHNCLMCTAFDYKLYKNEFAKLF